MEKVIPEQCAVVVGIPLDVDSFGRTTTVGASYAAEFAKRFASTAVAAAAYRQEVITPVIRGLTTIQNLGAAVFPAAGPREVAEALRRYRVVNLLTHCAADERIELSGEMLACDKLLAALPAAYTGVIELSLCGSASVAVLFKDRFPKASLLANLEETHPRLRVKLTARVLAILAQHPGGYVDTMADLRKALVAQL